MHYYPFNLKDYLVQTAHLPPLADLAYRRLIDLYYLEEAPIPNKPKWVANRIRMDSEEQIIGFVLREYFVLDRSVDPPLWRHDRCDKVIAKYQKKAAVARENGLQHKAGTKKEPKSDADRLLTKNHKPRTNNTPLPPEGEVLREEWWNAYPRKVGKPQAFKAYAAALARGATAQAIMGGLMRHLGCAQWQDQTKIPHPSTWLNRDGWNDEVATPPGPAGDDPKGWWTTRKGLLDKGIEYGLPAPPDPQDDPGGQAFRRFKASVWVKAGDGPWWDHQDTAYPLAVKLRDGGL